MNEVVACVGAGTIGRSWAILFAMHGYDVNLFDISSDALKNCLAAIDVSLVALEDKEIIECTEIIQDRIKPTLDLSAAVDGVVYVQESVIEDAEIKRAIFAKLDHLSPKEALLASSTSEISGSELFADLPGRARCIVAHPLNPPHLIPLVELCPTPWTGRTVLDRARIFFEGINQKPIVVKKEISGFIANRLQVAVLGEALHLVGEGFCSTEDIDRAMKDGLALRWVLIGPFETAHLNAPDGYKSYMAAYGDVHRKIIDDLNVAYEWPASLINRVHEELSEATPADRVPDRQQWRNQRLIELSSHLSRKQ